MLNQSKLTEVNLKPLYLTTAQVAQMTGFTEKALGSMRDRREGPQYFKVGRLVRYRSVDIHTWIQQGGAMV